MAEKQIVVSSLAKEVGLSTMLVLRPKATDMFEISLQQCGAPQNNDIYICDMKGIEDCSGSFVDEFILKWLKRIRNTDNSLFVLKNVNEDVLYTITSALNLRNKLDMDSMVLLLFQNGEYQAISDKLEKNVREVFDLMRNGQKVTARLISDKFSIELNSAGNRLKKLYDAHLAVRLEQSVENGGKFEYYLPLI